MKYLEQTLIILILFIVSTCCALSFSFVVAFIFSPVWNPFEVLFFLMSFILFWCSFAIVLGDIRET